MKIIYDNYVENTFGEHKQADFKFIQFQNNYRHLLPQQKDASILDIGIGRGEMLSCFRNWGYSKYLGIDISSSTVSYCQSLGLNCERVNDTLLWLSERKENFDLITLIDVLEHIKKEETIIFLEKIKYSLKDGGKVIIQVPNLQSPDAYLHRYYDFTHETAYLEHSLQQVLMSCGFMHFSFHGFEDSISNNPKELIRKALRSCYWKCVRLQRKISGNLNPVILNPIFYVVAEKR